MSVEGSALQCGMKVLCSAPVFLAPPLVTFMYVAVSQKSGPIGMKGPPRWLAPAEAGFLKGISENDFPSEIRVISEEKTRFRNPDF